MSTTTPPTPPGLVLAPLQGVRRQADGEALAGWLAPPYDLMTLEEADRLRARERSVVSLTLPVDAAGAPDYAGAAATLRDWCNDGTLARDDARALYAYELLTPAGSRVRGLLGAVQLAAAEAGIILPHENTMAGPVADRLALLAATEANLEPIYLIYDGGPVAAAAIDAALAHAVVAEAVSPDGITHRLGVINDPAILTAMARELLPRPALIADGHHRYATYLAYQTERRHEVEPDHADGPWDFGLAFLVDGTRSGPDVEPIHRVLPELTFRAAVTAAAGCAQVEYLAADSPDEWEARLARETGPAVVVTDGSRAALIHDLDRAAIESALPAERKAAWRALDVAVVHHYLISSVWGLEDNEAQVGYEHDRTRALRAAAKGNGVALLMRATPLAAVLAVAADGDRMPRKSTLVTPKPASGLVLRVLEPQ